MECAFATLEKSNQDFLQNMMNTIRRETGTQPSLPTVLNAILIDYQRQFEQGSEPDLLGAYFSVKKRCRRK